MDKSHLEPLGGGIQIYVNDVHHFWTDTILLADFSRPVRARSCVDLGTGCATIPLLWLKNDRSLKITGVELQQDACELARKSAALNGLEDNLTILNCDLRELKGKLEFGCHDLVVCNPPYKQGGSGVKNPDGSKLIARHETECTLDDICLAASRLLQFGGRFCVCQRPERLCDVTEAMRRHSIEPKRLRLVQQRKSKAPKLFLLEGRKNGNKGFLNVLPTLFIEDEAGGFSREMLEIYGSYKQQEESQ